jgi:hypothetical protein
LRSFELTNVDSFKVSYELGSDINNRFSIHAILNVPRVYILCLCKLNRFFYFVSSRRQCERYHRCSLLLTLLHEPQLVFDLVF